MIMASGIELILDHKKILNNINFQIPKGKITVFMGPSGAGKTTLLKCIANLNPQYNGTLLLDGKPIKQLTLKERAHSLGFIFQQYNLFGHMNVLENCAFPMRCLFGLSREQAQQSALEILSAVAMAEYKDSYPAKLSGGQQQRVAIARALSLKPNLLLLDEPSSALDPQSTAQLAQLLKNLCSDGITIALSSHDMSLVQSVADLIYFVDAGHIKQICDLSVANEDINEHLCKLFSQNT